MKRLMLLMAALASVASAMPLAALAGDGDQGRGAARQEARGRGPDRGGYEPRGPERIFRERAPGDRGPQDRGGRRWEDDSRSRARFDDRPRYVDERPRYEDRRRGDERDRPDYMQGPRPNYMRPVPGSGRRGYLPDNYRGDVVDNYQRFRLRPPPHGYAWVRVGNGFALVEMGSGRIFDRVN
jgi:Ni/Co efflux regulator RcnB